ncbi:MAG: methyltransferase [Lachnospiraceae bacterium]|nr:methyltransferase [Lachnospiraceae bacterium]
MMMNNKALVEVYVPAAEQTYDVYIPLESKMNEVVYLLSNALSDLSNGKFKATDETIVCDAKTGIIYNINIEVAELGIKTGSRLMLI